MIWNSVGFLAIIGLRIIIIEQNETIKRLLKWKMCSILVLQMVFITCSFCISAKVTSIVNWIFKLRFFGVYVYVSLFLSHSSVHVAHQMRCREKAIEKGIKDFDTVNINLAKGKRHTKTESCKHWDRTLLD